eukprot:5939467-Amphidinium_carterae.1
MHAYRNSKSVAILPSVVSEDFISFPGRDVCCFMGIKLYFGSVISDCHFECGGTSVGLDLGPHVTSEQLNTRSPYNL